MNTTAPPADMLTAEQVAACLVVSTKTLHNWRYLGRGPAYAIAAWIRDHEVTP